MIASLCELSEKGLVGGGEQAFDRDDADEARLLE
jgi:hypothetical protein